MRLVRTVSPSSAKTSIELRSTAISMRIEFACGCLSGAETRAGKAGDQAVAPERVRSTKI